MNERLVAKNLERKAKKDAEKVVKAWNVAHPVGTRVVVTKDDGSKLKTTTRHPASLIAGYIPVVWVYEITGCYRLDRVRVAE